MNNHREIYVAEQLPVSQNRIFHSEQEARNCVRSDIILVQDMSTGLIFNRSFDPALLQYDADYQNEQALSKVFQHHLANVLDVILRHFCDHSLIEVGCGKGYFLEQLQSNGYSVTGLDPAYEGSNPAIRKEYFSPEIGIQAEGIIMRHVLEHVINPLDFLFNILKSNNGVGKIYIEVPCFDWICKQHAWFDIFYEHVNYFKLDDFDRIFGEIYESGHTFGGQYLYVVANLATLRRPDPDAISVLEFPNDFLSSVGKHAARLSSQNHENRSKAAIWGGASKGVIFALFMQRAGVNLDIVIDINPAKQGKYLPVTGFKVYSPTDAVKALAPGAELFVMNSNYLNEIKMLTQNQFKYLLVDNEDI